MPSARAEEGVIHLLMLDGENFKYASARQPEHFSSPVLGKVFGLLRDKWERGQACTMASLSANLTPEEMSLLARIQEKPVSVANGERAMADYITAIRRQRSADTDDALMAFRKSKLSNGGTTE